MEGRIKLHRKIDQWGWRSKPNTFSLFMHLLTTANIEQKTYRGHTIDRGDCIIGRKALAKKIGISEQAIRTALGHLKSTNEITIKSTNEFSIITLLGFDLYQSKDDYLTSKSTSTSTNEQPTNNQPTTTPKEGKKEKKSMFGNFVSLTQDEYNRLVVDFSESILKDKIEDINNYCGSKGKKYKDYNLTIRSWLKKDGVVKAEDMSDLDLGKKWFEVTKEERIELIKKYGEKKISEAKFYYIQNK